LECDCCKCFYTYYETDDQEILRAREKFNELEKKYDEEIKEEKEKVLAVGGLKIIGTERHESRRIDNQLIIFLF